jgi:hypothetical protein
VAPDADESAEAAEEWLERIIDAGEASVPNGIDKPAERLLALIVLVPRSAED